MTIRHEIEQQPWTHDSLKRAWEDFKTKDCVDSLYNARLLVQACEERLRELQDNEPRCPVPLSHAMSGRY